MGVGVGMEGGGGLRWLLNIVLYGKALPHNPNPNSHLCTIPLHIPTVKTLHFFSLSVYKIFKRPF